MNVREWIQEKILLLDGAMGTMLQEAGLTPGELPEIYNLTHPEVVRRIHRAYVEAGSDVVTTNTFQANEQKLQDSGYTPETVIQAGVRLARESGARFVALDIGPIGQLMQPMGVLTFDRAYAIFRREILAGVQAGADLILFETMSDLLELKAGILAAKENCGLPVFASMTFQEDGRTFVGCDPKSAAVTLSGLGVDALGLNCSLGPEELVPLAEELLRYSRVPVLLQPNAGLPKIKDGKTVYEVSPEAYGKVMLSLAEKGAAVLGGCCGTTPEFIRVMARGLSDRNRRPAPVRRVTAVCSGSRTVELENRVTAIGERINPTGKKTLKERLRARDFDYIMGEAIVQARAGADILDVNCGLPELDEAETLCRAVQAVQSVTDLPLQIDSSDPEAIARAARIYNGKPIINSVNGKAESLAAVLPLAAKYGAAVVGLTLDENGIPETAQGRLAIAERIVAAAANYGIPKEDILIDCLVLTASAQQELTLQTLLAVRMVKERLGVKTALGVSNVSFGLPARPLLNSVFLAAGFGAGLDAAIVNPMSREIMDVFRAYRVLNRQDRDAEKYIAQYNRAAAPAPVPETGGVQEIKEYIIQGRKEETRARTRALLREQEPLEIIDGQFIPALDIVGERYEKGSIFLPQLIQSAEAVKAGFEVIRETMPQSGAGRGEILLATVAGDIHDIGKNIAKMLLENYGYTVIDLGKDVPIETVVETAMKTGVRLIGLSALMTTTVTSMKDTVTALRAAGCTAEIMVGGAVLNEEYLRFVGADHYVKDARADVAIANRIFGGKA